MTPCVRICKIKDEYCIACGRSLCQIKEWHSYSEEKKKEITEYLKKTFKTMIKSIFDYK